MAFIRQDEIRPDDRYYWVTENPDGSFSKIPKELEDREEVDQDGNPMYVKVYDAETNSMVDSDKRLITRGLKHNHITQVKQTANQLLSQSDWTVIRKVERNIEIPATIAAYRSAVIQKADELEAAISAATTVEELMVINIADFPNNGVI